MTTAATTEALPGHTTHTTATVRGGRAEVSLGVTPRRVPVALLTSLATVACAALAVDLLRVHTAHSPATAWRVSATHWLSGHGPGDPAVVIAGSLTALLGVGMVVLALTPGLRRRSTVRTGTDRVDTTVDRSAVESPIHDTVADVNGITTVRVTVTPEKVWQRPAPTPEQASTTPAAKEVDQ